MPAAKNETAKRNSNFRSEAIPCLPSTGERAFIQVKSQTSDAELSEYVAQLDSGGPYERMFFVYHSGVVHDPGDDTRVVVIGPDRLADLVIDAGLVGWLIRKVS